jgi:hypothetical protein
MQSEDTMKFRLLAALVAVVLTLISVPTPAAAYFDSTPTIQTLTLDATPTIATTLDAGELMVRPQMARMFAQSQCNLQPIYDSLPLLDPSTYDYFLGALYAQCFQGYIDYTNSGWGLDVDGFTFYVLANIPVF